MLEIAGWGMVAIICALVFIFIVDLIARKLIEGFAKKRDEEYEHLYRKDQISSALDLRTRKVIVPTLVYWGLTLVAVIMSLGIIERYLYWLDNKHVDEKLAEVYGDQPVNAYVKDAVSLQKNRWSWCSEFFISGARPRSLFSLIDQLKINGDRQKYTEIATLLNVDSFTEELKGLNDSDPLPAFPAEMLDEIRTSLITRSSLPIDLLRSTYTGVLNLGVIAICGYLIALGYVRSQWYQKCWRRQKVDPVNEDRAVVKDENLALKQLAWKEFWETKNLSIHTTYITASIDSSTKQGIAPSPMLRLVDTIFADLRTPQSWDDWIQLNTANRELDRICEQAQRRLADESPSNQEDARNYPELMTQLGFLGTIIGIILGMSSAAMTQVPSEDPLYRSSAVGDMLAGLSVAFSTTLLGLVSAILIKYYLGQWRNQELMQIQAGVSSVRGRFKKCIRDIFER